MVSGGGFFSAPAAAAGISGPAAMMFAGNSGNPLQGLLNLNQGTGGGNINLMQMLAQILQQGVQPDQSGMESNLADLNAQEGQGKRMLQNRFSSLGRSTLSSEFRSQEQDLMDSFNRARLSARSNATKTGMNIYNTQLSPLLSLLRMAI